MVRYTNIVYETGREEEHFYPPDVMMRTVACRVLTGRSCSATGSSADFPSALWLIARLIDGNGYEDRCVYVPQRKAEP